MCRLFCTRNVHEIRATPPTPQRIHTTSHSSTNLLCLYPRLHRPAKTSATTTSSSTATATTTTTTTTSSNKGGGGSSSSRRAAAADLPATAAAAAAPPAGVFVQDRWRSGCHRHRCDGTLTTDGGRRGSLRSSGDGAHSALPHAMEVLVRFECSEEKPNAGVEMHKDLWRWDCSLKPAMCHGSAHAVLMY